MRNTSSIKSKTKFVETVYCVAAAAAAAAPPEEAKEAVFEVGGIEIGMGARMGAKMVSRGKHMRIGTTTTFQRMARKTSRSKARK